MSRRFYEMLKEKYGEDPLKPVFVHCYGNWEQHIVHVSGKPIRLPKRDEMEKIAMNFFGDVPHKVEMAEDDFVILFECSRKNDIVISFTDESYESSYRGHGIVIKPNAIAVSTAWRGAEELTEKQRASYLEFADCVLKKYFE